MSFNDIHTNQDIVDYVERHHPGLRVKNYASFSGVLFHEKDFDTYWVFSIEYADGEHYISGLNVSALIPEIWTRTRPAIFSLRDLMDAKDEFMREVK